jgi:hypothetical protein
MNFIKIGYHAWLEFRVHKIYTETSQLVSSFSYWRRKKEKKKKDGGKEMVFHLYSEFKLGSRN